MGSRGLDGGGCSLAARDERGGDGARTIAGAAHGVSGAAGQLHVSSGGGWTHSLTKRRRAGLLPVPSSSVARLAALTITRSKGLVRRRRLGVAGDLEGVGGPRLVGRERGEGQCALMAPLGCGTYCASGSSRSGARRRTGIVLVVGECGEWTGGCRPRVARGMEGVRVKEEGG